MVIKVGINGFGRIGRVIFRSCFQNSEIELSAINDPAIDAEYICYLIKFDSTHGKFKGTVTHKENEIHVNEQRIKVFHEKQPASVPWQTVGVQYVIEASGMFTSLEKASGHLASDGVKRVIVTAPSIDVPMVILGVNDSKVNTEHKVISCASSTLYCLAPLVCVLQQGVGVAEGFVTSIHAMTPSLKPLDGLCLRGKHWRDHRSIHQNIIPATTAACKALGKIIPEVKDRLTGLAFRVPIVNVSVLDLTVRLNGNTSLQEIMKDIEKASKTTMQNIIKISNEQAVSSDFIGDSHSCIFDFDSSIQLKPNFFKLICWYENEYSYACRVIDSIFFSEKQFQLSNQPSKMTYVRTRPLRKQDVLQQTECYRKEKSIECKCSALNNKLLCSTLQDTGLPCQNKTAPRPITLKKPASSYNSGTSSTSTSRDPKRRNEAFKIWNDEKEVTKTGPRQNRNSFFHSCVAFGPQNPEPTDCMKAQERLENVKREFSKMVNITEDLLKKSYSSKFQLNSMLKSGKDEFSAAASENSKSTKIESNLVPDRTSQKSKPMVDICGDCNPNPVATDSKFSDTCSKDEESYNEKDLSDYNMTELNLSEQQDTRNSLNHDDIHMSTANQILSMKSEARYCDVKTTVKEFSNKTKTTITDTYSDTANVQCLLSAMTNIKKIENTETVANIKSIYEGMTSKAYNNIEDKDKNSESGRAEEINGLNKNKVNTIVKIKTEQDRNLKNMSSNINQRHINVENTQTVNIIEADRGHFEINSRPPQPANRHVITDDVHSMMFVEGQHLGKIINNRPSNRDSRSNEQMTIESQHSSSAEHHGRSVLDRKDEEHFNVEITDATNKASLAPEKIQVGKSQKEHTNETGEDSEGPDSYKLMDEQLKKRNIILIDGEKCKTNGGMINLCYLENDECDMSSVKDTSLQHQTVDVLSFVSKSGLIEADASRTSTENTFSTLSNLHASRRKQDIYDKLDSVSATDSNNSFEINERKSQVIHITDVTNSLDDIARLDKICRIIEISDELSDKLFSSLDNDVGDIKKKKWSFRDLCERIKLDEFCNKVFGKTAT